MKKSGRGISYGIEVFDDAQDTDAFRAMFAVRGKALYPEMDFMLQAMLQVKVDGIFGTQTETSLKAFQKNVKITVDGICGAETWKKVVEHMNANR